MCWNSHKWIFVKRKLDASYKLSHRFNYLEIIMKVNVQVHIKFLIYLLSMTYISLDWLPKNKSPRWWNLIFLKVSGWKFSRFKNHFAIFLPIYHSHNTCVIQNHQLVFIFVHHIWWDMWIQFCFMVFISNAVINIYHRV